MKICSTISETRAACREARTGSRLLGLVPTMGALHAGHLSLVRAAKAQCPAVAVSIFVNPTQFGPAEDFSKYPRTFEKDCALLEEEGVDIVFAPSVEEMYPKDAATWVTVEDLSQKLDGRSRPGHFRGVTTVVAKLFHVVEPDRAYFGQKDAAQVAIIKRMVRDLKFGVEIVVGPIVRESDGLAMSSRNVYLNAAERQQALVLHRTLLEMEKQFRAGKSTGEILEAGKAILASEPGARLDYLEIVDPETLDQMDRPAGGLAAIAAYVGATRLIDNLLLAPR